MADHFEKFHVIKRDGKSVPMEYDKIQRRIQRMAIEMKPQLSDVIDSAAITQKVVAGVMSGMHTSEIDTLLAETCAYITDHPDYLVLAARIAVSNLQKETPGTFAEVVNILKENVAPVVNVKTPLVSDELVSIVNEHAKDIEKQISYDRDFMFSYFGLKSLKIGYLQSVNKKTVERPQHMFMRVALGLHGRDLAAAFETYKYMADHYFIHATPTLFNAGTPTPQLSSCFLLTMKEDSIDGIYTTLKKCALISKNAGGIGVSTTNIRATQSYIRGTNGESNGLVPMLRVFNDTARYVDQGGNKRKGAFAMYLEPWHTDVVEFLDLKKNHGKEEQRARDLFYALWVPDLFMRRVENDEMWSLFCPNETPGLTDTWGEQFEALYIGYEKEGRARKTMRAQELWFRILESQIETGTPYILYKDACNKKSNQKNLGTIRSSNLCCEIIEYTAPDEIAVCNLASIALPRLVKRLGKTVVFDFKLLHRVVKIVTRNLNKIIDINYYPVKEARKSNMRHRPIGIGVQGLADVFIAMRYPWDSIEARLLNAEIFETIYFAALEASCELAMLHGPYETFKGSPISAGLFQFDLWGDDKEHTPVSDRWDWEGLRTRVMEFGVRNSLVTAPMPTATTSHILGNNECFEPYTSNMYVRRVLAGEFIVFNRSLVEDLADQGLWTPEIKQRIKKNNGSVQGIEAIPEHIRNLYKTVWEISQRTLIDMASDRGRFVDQSQSMNLFLATPTFESLGAMLFYGWKKGLKTGIYYLRTRPVTTPQQFTVIAPTEACPRDCDSCGA